MSKCLRHCPEELASQRGLTLVEILVALLIGLFLIGGMIQLLVGTKQTYRVTEALSIVQENGRFAIEAITRDARMAGFTGCPPTNTVTNLLKNSSTVWWENFGAGTVQGFDGNGSPAAFPGRAIGTAAGDRITGTDAVTLLAGGGDEYAVISHNRAATQFTLDRTPNLTAGNIVMVCDASRTLIFQVTAVSGAVISYAVDSRTPGNVADSLTKAFSSGARLVEFCPTAYYVGHNSAGSIGSLYRFQLQVSGGNASFIAQELVEPVSNLQLHYGVDANNDNQVDLTYLDASGSSAVTNWTQVLSIRVNLLLASSETNLSLAPKRLIFPSADTGVANTAGSSYTAADQRLYQSFYTTVSLRNRLP